MQLITGLKQILPNYDGFILDLWGVVHDGIAPYHGAIEAIEAMRKANKTVVFISNAPRSAAQVTEMLQQMKVPVEQSQVLTSGDALRYCLKTNAAYHKVYQIGSSDHANFLDGLGVVKVDDIAAADCLLFTYYINAITGDVTQFDELFKEAIAHKLPFLCANSDKIAMHGSTTRFCGGTFAARYVALGGRVKHFGKPYRTIYDQAINEIFAIKGIKKHKIVMIGDTIDTDIAGANAVGIDSAFIRRRMQDLTHAMPTWELPALQL